MTANPMAPSSTAPIRPVVRTIDGLAIRYAESDPRSSRARDSHALLLCPWPESLYAFEPTWNRLSDTHIWCRSTYPGSGTRSDATS